MLDGERTVVQNGPDGIKTVTYKKYFLTIIFGEAIFILKKS